jgi:hypothetical protein
MQNNFFDNSTYNRLGLIEPIDVPYKSSILKYLNLTLLLKQKKHL